jgi:hypothetical protein
LVCAAWLHDIGYTPALGVTGFHPLDGARFLVAAGVSRRLTGLVAHHSCAALEAELRGLAAELAEFDDEDGAVRDALWYCDIITLATPEEAALRVSRREPGCTAFAITLPPCLSTTVQASSECSSRSATPRLPSP